MNSSIEAELLRAQIAEKQSQLGKGIYKEGTTFYNDLQEQISGLNDELA